MPNPFLDKNVFSPHLASEVAAAYERNVERGHAPNTTVVNEVGKTSLAATIMINTAEAKATGSTGLTSLDKIYDPAIRRDFEKSFTLTTELYKHLNLTVPTAEDCAEAGINFEELSYLYERMHIAGLEPAVALTPVIDLEDWRTLYGILESGPAVNGGSYLRNGGLYVADEIAAQWHNLTVLPDRVKAIPMEGNGAIHDERRVWSLRLIASQSEPSPVNVDHSRNSATHPTISEYLSTQAAHLYDCQKPLDRNGYCCWLKGDFTFSSGTPLNAPIGYYEDSMVIIVSHIASTRYLKLGARQTLC